MSQTKKAENNSGEILLGARKEIAGIMSKAITSCDIGRDDVAKKMSEFLGRKITRNMIDAYASEAHESHTPALDVAIAFDLAVGKAALSGYFASKFGGQIALGKDIPLLKLAQIHGERILLDQREKKVLLAAGLVDRNEMDANARLDMLEADVEAYQLMLAWLMAKAGDESVNFLRDQAFEMEDGDKDKYEIVVGALDRVRELALEWKRTHKS